MAEIIGLSASIFTVLGQALDVVRLLNRVVADERGYGNSKLKAARARLFTESSQLERWTQYIENHVGWEVLVSRISLYEEDTINSLLDGIRSLQAAHNRFAEVEAGLAGKNRDAIDAVHAINEALDKIVPTPPRYFDDRIGVEEHRRDSREQRGQPSAAGHTTKEEPLGKELPIKVDSGQRTLQSLHSVAMTGLREVAQVDDNTETLGKLMASLKGWGEVLFGPLALDILLQQGSGDVWQSIRSVIITTFVDILLVEERLLEDTVGYGNRSISKTRIKVISALGQEEVSTIVRKRSCMIPTGIDWPLLVAQASAKIERAIEDLYELLPAIQSLRRQRMLMLELQKAPLRRPTPSTPGKEAAESTTGRLIQAAIDGGSSILAGNSFDQDLQAFAKKELEVLQEYKANRVSGLAPDDRRIAEECLHKFQQSLADHSTPEQAFATDSKGKGKAASSDEDFVRALQELNFRLPRPG